MEVGLRPRKEATKTGHEAGVLIKANNMTIVKTVLEWAYQPADFFEFPYRMTMPDCEIQIQDGTVRVTLNSPLDPVPDALKSRIALEIEAIFRIRRLRTHKRFELKGSHTIQFAKDGGRRIDMSGTCVAKATVRADMIALDSAGNVVQDTRAERIAADARFVDELAPKISRSPLLKVLVGSYSAAVEDPPDELTHLYEIREALARHYRDDHRAQKTLGITKADWKRLGQLANDEPLQQSRHRGKHLPSIRPATEAELEEAREISRRLILAFAESL